MVLKDIPLNVWSLGLERVRDALERLGHPEKKYIHVLVAGTNGKGSTCVYLERILLTSGHSVGTTISPHITDFVERFRINGLNADQAELSGIRDEIMPLVGDLGLTYFEWCIILSVKLFEKHNVDYGIFEIGLGGRYDAANALDPAVCLITDISLDHTDLLGATIEEIAREKAAIARKGRPLITAAKGRALNVIRDYAAECGAVFMEVCSPALQETSMKGSSQPMNAALAIDASRALGFNLREEQISHALKTAFLPGRIEQIGGRIILDVAHNPASIRELTKYLDEVGFHGVGVFGVLADKDYSTMIAMLKEVCPVIHIAPVNSDRSWDAKVMEGFLEAGRVKSFASITEAFKVAISTGGKVVVTGSFYTVGEVRGSIICQGS